MKNKVLLFLLPILVTSPFLNSANKNMSSLPQSEKTNHYVTFNLDASGPDVSPQHSFGVFTKEPSQVNSSDLVIDIFGINFNDFDVANAPSKQDSIVFKANKLKSLFSGSNVDFSSDKTSFFLSGVALNKKTFTERLIQNMNNLQEGQTENRQFIKQDFLAGVVATDRTTTNYRYYLLGGNNMIQDFSFDFDRCSGFTAWYEKFIDPPEIRDKYGKKFDEFKQAIYAFVREKYGDDIYFVDKTNKRLHFKEGVVNQGEIQILSNYVITAMDNISLGFEEEMKAFTKNFSVEKIKQLYKFVVYDVQLSIMMYSSLQVNTYLHFLKDTVNLRATNNIVPNFLMISVSPINIAALNKLLSYEYSDDYSSKIDSAENLPDIDGDSSFMIEVWKTGDGTTPVYKFGIRINYEDDYRYVLNSKQMQSVLGTILISKDFSQSEKEFYCKTFTEPK